MSRIALLGAGFIGNFYCEALRRTRYPTDIRWVYSRSRERAEALAAKHNVASYTTDMLEAICADDVDVVLVAVPNHLHQEAVVAAAQAGKAILCTKPLGRNAKEARTMLEAVESAGVFHGYLEDLVYTPKTLKALQSVRDGAIGRVLWVRSRETHPGPHSDWFFDKERAGGGAIVDMGCHCVEIARNFIGKNIRPVEVICWADTQVHPIDAEDHAVGLVKYQNGAIGQFEVSWTFRGGMDLRDEVAGTDGTIWLNHWLRTGFEMYSAADTSSYVAEKAETSSGWLFPVGDEPKALGYVDMFDDVFGALQRGDSPMETFYDGYIVNSIVDAAYRSIESKIWEPVEADIWRGHSDVPPVTPQRDYDSEHWLIKRERMPDGQTKLILRHKKSGDLSQRLEV